MRAASLSTGWAKLHNGLKTVRAQWEETQAVWHDPVRQDFEENVWALLEPSVVGALHGIDRLSQVLNDLQQDCG